MTKLTPSQVQVLGAANGWAEPWFHSALLAGLVREGIDPAGLQAVQAALTERHPCSVAELLAELQAMPTGSRGNAVDVVCRLEVQDQFNRECYARKSLELHRVISWPNNQRTKVLDPSLYFDIYDDLPYRDTPRFITPKTPIGSAGSCFAMRIAHQLQVWGYNYVIEEDDMPPDFPLELLSTTSYRMAPARWGTLFNAPSMRQMVERAYGLWQPDPIVVNHNGRFLDPYRSIPALYRDLDGYVADFEKHNQALRRALDSCEVFILTLGLTEAWRFAHNGSFTSIAPTYIDTALVRPHDLTVDENVVELERLYDVYSRHRPGIKLIVSVSPVPLNKTFSSHQHVVAANALSKATLRVAVDIFCRNHSRDVHYFPSYEVVTYGTRNAWESDMRHVSAEAVSRVMKLFRAMFLADQNSMLEPLWHEEPVYHHSAGERLRGIARTMARLLGFKR